MDTGTTLVIGANFRNHDSGIFCIDVEQQRAFGMTTERMTRYKHDMLPPVPVIEELVHEWQIDPSAVRRVIVATSLKYQMEDYRVKHGTYEEMAAFRGALHARYLKDVVQRTEQYHRLSKATRYRMLMQSAEGRRYIKNHFDLHPAGVPFAELVAAEFSGVFRHADVQVRAYDHHLAHAVSSLVLSGLEDPLMVTLDGWGDGFFSKAFVRDGASLREVSASPSIHVNGSPARSRLNGTVPPHVLQTGIFEQLTLGHFYSIIVWLLGFEPMSDEGKVEALAAYASPENELLEAMRKTVRLDPVAGRLVISPDDAYRLFFDLERLEGYVQRLGREAVAAATQRFLEERAVDLLQALMAANPRKSIALSGGCAANVILNMHIYERLCENLYIVPAMGDDGTALGTAVLALKDAGVADEQLAFLRDGRLPYFGNHHSRASAKRALDCARARLTCEDRSEDWPEAVAHFVHEGQIGAIYQGRMEWGPRALGNRSIVANPCLAETRERINGVVKKRPLFQPFCPTILEEEKDRLFEHAYMNRHMTCAFRMREQFWKSLPSAIHIDGTARAQFLGSADNPTFHRVLTEFKRLSGFGVLINTSFNLHGRTIVNTPGDAIDDFLDSQMDFMVLDGYLARRRSTS